MIPTYMFLIAIKIGAAAIGMGIVIWFRHHWVHKAYPENKPPLPGIAPGSIRYMPPEPREQLDKCILDMVEKHKLHIATFEDEQVVQAIKQAILAGDFVRYTQNNCLTGYASSVVYQPYREKQSLKYKISHLEMENQGLRLCIASMRKAGDECQARLVQLENDILKLEAPQLQFEGYSE